MTERMKQKQKRPGAGEMILAKNHYYSLDDFQTKRNNNVIVVGVAGSGKTRYVVTPNLLQAEGSYVVSDPKGMLRRKYGDYLKERGYRVLNIDFDNPECSDHYNPLHYIHCSADILKIAHLLTYTQSTNSRRGGDPFWEQASELYFSALIAYLYECARPEEQTLESVTKLIYAAETNENNASELTTVDRMMDAMYRKNPDSFAVRQYRKFRVAAGRTMRSIQISASSKLNAMDFPEVRRMMSGETMDFTRLGREKTVLFVNVSDTDRTMDDFVNLFFSQIMRELVRHADEACEDGRLPVPVRFILDDFATNVLIDDFPRMIASIRSRGISVMLCVQDESQLKAAYGDNGETIVNNCDTYLYLGGNDAYTTGRVSHRADIRPHTVWELPVGQGWLMRRGEKAEQVETFDLALFEREIRNAETGQAIEEEAR